MKGKPTYAGKISNQGSQYVTAPFSPKGQHGGKVREGGDLRTGGGSKKK